MKYAVIKYLPFQIEIIEGQLNESLNLHKNKLRFNKKNLTTGKLKKNRSKLFGLITIYDLEINLNKKIEDFAVKLPGGQYKLDLNRIGYSIEIFDGQDNPIKKPILFQDEKLLGIVDKGRVDLNHRRIHYNIKHHFNFVEKKSEQLVLYKSKIDNSLFCLRVLKPNWHGGGDINFFRLEIDEWKQLSDLPLSDDYEKRDNEFFSALEMDVNGPLCAEVNCQSKVVRYSSLCPIHHFEMMTGRKYLG